MPIVPLEQRGCLDLCPISWKVLRHSTIEAQSEKARKRIVDNTIFKIHLLFQCGQTKLESELELQNEGRIAAACC